MASGSGGGGTDGGGGGAPPPFLSKTYEMVDDAATDAIVSWGPANNSFVVWNPPEFARDLLPKYFKHNNFSSFVRQLNTYGFRKVDPDRWEFANEGFLRGQKHLLKTINRRKPAHANNQPQQPQVQTSSATTCVEVGKFGLEEEVERLKRDKNVLMQELVRLRQQQQASDQQIQTIGKRLQGMEQRQQQMMSFLAKAMQSPGFLAQLVQQNDNNRRIAGVNKKRRLPTQGNQLDGESTLPDGQIIKYQPLMNEAAKSMLMQILKFDTSPRLEPFSSSENFFIENFPSSLQALDSRNASTRNSGVTLSEVPTSSGVPVLSGSSGFSAVCSSSVSSETQSSASIADRVTKAKIPQMGVASGVSEAIVQHESDKVTEFSQMQGIMPSGNSFGLSNENYLMPEGESMYTDSMPSFMEDQMPIAPENLSPDTDMEGLSIDRQKLPAVSDSFWEQFFIVSPLSGEADEVDSCTQDDKEIQPDMENIWDSTRSMDHLTEQMGLLTSETTM